MFSLATGVYQAYFAPPELNVLIVGESGVGKTTLLERIKVTQFSKSSGSGTRKDSVIVERPERVPAQAFGVRTLGHQDSSSVLSHASDDIVASPAYQKRIVPARAVPGHLMLRQQSAASTTSKKQGSTSNSTNRNTAPPLHPESSSKRAWVCPAPSKYRQAAVEEDDDDELVVKPLEPCPDPPFTTTSKIVLPDSASLPTPEHPASSTRISPEDDPSDHDFDPNRFSITSMESIDIGESSSEFLNNLPSTSHTNTAIVISPPSRTEDATTRHATTLTVQADPAVDSVDYDLKLNHKMLPLTKIRPTMGMNLATVDICGAKCHFQDLSGKFQNVWRSYYGDCDAVIFVFRVENNNQATSHQSDGGNHDVDEDEQEERRRRAEKLNPKAQLALLTHVRGAIADDVPFLILGHLFDTSMIGAHTDVLFSSSTLLPHYHNPLQGVFFSRAVSGQGVRSAMEWLIPLAKRQQQVRQQQHLHR